MSDWQAAAPDAVTALVTKAKTVIQHVYDGVAVNASGALEVIVVAGSADPTPNPDQPYIEHRLPDPGYTQDVTQTFTVYSEIAVLNGDAAKLADARSRAYQILVSWAQTIADDPELNNTVMQSWVSDISYHGQQTPAGARAVLLVGIGCMVDTGS